MTWEFLLWPCHHVPVLCPMSSDFRIPCIFQGLYANTSRHGYIFTFLLFYTKSSMLQILFWTFLSHLMYFGDSSISIKTVLILYLVPWSFFAWIYHSSLVIGGCLHSFHFFATACNAAVMTLYLSFCTCAGIWISGFRSWVRSKCLLIILLKVTIFHPQAVISGSL